MNKVIDFNNMDINYVAKLARIYLSHNELEKFTPQLSKIIDYINKLNELNTDGIPPTTHVINIKNVLRKDICKRSLDRDEVLKNAPDEENGFFKVPKIIS